MSIFVCDMCEVLWFNIISMYFISSLFTLQLEETLLAIVQKTEIRSSRNKCIVEEF